MSADLKEQFTVPTAVRIHERGIEEEKQKLLPAPLPEAGGEVSHVEFTAAGHLDWRFLNAARIIGAPMQLSQVLAEGLGILRLGRIASRAMTQISSPPVGRQR